MTYIVPHSTVICHAYIVPYSILSCCTYIVSYAIVTCCTYIVPYSTDTTLSSYLHTKKYTSLLGSHLCETRNKLTTFYQCHVATILQDVRYRSGEDVGSNHHLVVAHIKLKIKRTVTPIRLLKWFKSPS